MVPKLSASTTTMTWGVRRAVEVSGDLHLGTVMKMLSSTLRIDPLQRWSWILLSVVLATRDLLGLS